MNFRAAGEVVRVVPMPAVGPGYDSPNYVDVNGDGTEDFSFDLQALIPTDYPTSGISKGLRVGLSSDSSVTGQSYYSAAVGVGEVIGSQLSLGLAWLTNAYPIAVSVQYQNYRTGLTRPWDGVLADPAKPYLGVRFTAEDGTHYGWIRFGFKVGPIGSYPGGPAIIEWAYETQPDTPVVITPPAIPNDSLSSAAELPGTSFFLWSDNTFATAEPNEPNPDGLGAGASLWWKWTAPADGDLSLASVDGLFETVLSAFTGNDVGQLSAIASSEWKCSGGALRISHDIQFAVDAGTTYYIKVDSQVTDGMAAPRGEVHLQGTFSTLRMVFPTNETLPVLPWGLYLEASTKGWDGPRQSLTFEADETQVAIAQPNEMSATWFNPVPGVHSLRAVWTSPDGTVRKSPPVTIQLRPGNDGFFDSSFIQSTPVSIRAGNYFASSELGEPPPPAGANTNSVWWRWTAPADGVATVDLPDGNGDLSIAACTGWGPWVSNIVQIAANGPDPVVPGRMLNHLQFAVTNGAVYAIAVRSMIGNSSWVPSGECDAPVYPSREFTLNFDFVPDRAGKLLLMRNGNEMLASFATGFGRHFAIEASSDLQQWVEVTTGTATGDTQLTALGIDLGFRSRFFRLRVDP
ncbi:hypothetical protein GC207_10540 [bacterium]|nr:hypothetical protein [bacterium]